MPKDKIDTELIDKQELEIEKVTQEEIDERDEYVPHFKEKVELSDEQIERLRTEIFKGFESLKTERTNLDKKGGDWDALEAQYKGEMSDDTGLEFNLDIGVTQIKIDSVDRLIVKALLESDPKFTVTPRPAMAKMDKWEVTTEGQADYLDYKLDEEIDLVSPLRKTIHQSTSLQGGILKVPYVYERKKRRREERFSGKPEQDEQGKVRQPGLEAFVKQYPEAINEGNEGHWAFKDLVAGKEEVIFKAEYWEVTYNDPKPAFVDCRDFFVPKTCEGYAGLCNERLIVERQRYTWWELKKAEKNDDFEDVEKCKYEINEEGEGDDRKEVSNDKEIENHQDKIYTVLECPYYFNMVEDSEDPDDEIRILCFFEVGSKAFLGAILYPYDAVDSVYVPFYIKDKTAGFWKGGMAEDITGDHLIQNAFINFMLTGSWQELTVTPIVKAGSTVADQFLTKRFKHGVPIELPAETLDISKELTFLEKPQRAIGQQIINLLLFLGKLTDDKTGISAGLSGKESPMDPRAPASKTAMLLKQSGINISDYINVIVPSFNIVGQIILQLTHQMSKGGRKYRQRQRAREVTGTDPFAEITRDQMVAKTNIQSRAAAFDFDKLNQKRENLAISQALMEMFPGIMGQNPEGVFTLARTLVQSWSPLWKNKVDQLIGTPQEFQQGQMKVALQALQLYLKGMQKQKEVTGADQQPNFQEFVKMATQMMAQTVMPPEEDK